MAIASAGVKAIGASVTAGSMRYPPPGPPVPAIGRPASCRAVTSRLIVRVRDLEAGGQPGAGATVFAGEAQRLGDGVEAVGAVHGRPEDGDITVSPYAAHDGAMATHDDHPPRRPHGGLRRHRPRRRPGRRAAPRRARLAPLRPRSGRHGGGRRAPGHDRPRRLRRLRSAPGDHAADHPPATPPTRPPSSTTSASRSAVLAGWSAGGRVAAALAAARPDLAAALFLDRPRRRPTTRCRGSPTPPPGDRGDARRPGRRRRADGRRRSPAPAAATTRPATAPRC